MIPIREEQTEYCRGLADRLLAADMRVEAMLEPSHMNKKIKTAQKEQIPFMLIAGEREAEDGTVAIRRRGTREQEVVPFDDFLEMVNRLASTRSLELE